MSRYREQYNKYLEEHFRIKEMTDGMLMDSATQTHLNALSAKIQWCDEMATREAIRERRVKSEQIVEPIEYQYLQV